MGGFKLVPKRGVAYLVGMQSQISCSEYNQIFKVFFFTWRLQNK